MSEREQKIGGHHARLGYKLCDRPYTFTKFGYCSRRWVHLLLEKKESLNFHHWKEDAVSSYYCCHRLLSLRRLLQSKTFFQARNHPKSFFFVANSRWPQWLMFSTARWWKKTLFGGLTFNVQSFFVFGIKMGVTRHLRE